jgi:hypothetical protein
VRVRAGRVGRRAGRVKVLDVVVVIGGGRGGSVRWGGEGRKGMGSSGWRGDVNVVRRRVGVRMSRVYSYVIPVTASMLFRIVKVGGPL